MGTDDASVASRKHWLPSITATVFIGTLLLVALAYQKPLLSSDGDLPRHLRHGEWMLQHHALIRTDPFSYTKAGQPFIAFEYGSQLVYALANRAGGLPAVTVLAAFLIALTYTLLFRFLARRKVDPLLSCLVVGAAAFSGSGHWLARPHLFTMVGTLILLELLWPLGRLRLWPFPILFAVWANLHGGFLYGLVLTGIFLTGAVCDALREPAANRDFSRARFYAKALGIAAVATLVTPHGIRLYEHVIAVFGDAYVMNHTGEFASPNFHDVATKLFLWVMLAAIGAGFLSRRALSFITILIVLAGLDFALVHQRNMTLFGLTALPLLAVHLDAEWRALPILWKARAALAAGDAGARTMLWTVPVLLALTALALAGGRVAGRQLMSPQFNPELLPVRAVQVAREAGLSGHVFSDFGWGGYLVYAWPEQKVFIDGGADFYGGALMQDYGIIRADLPGWRQLMKRWDLSVMVVRAAAPVASDITFDGSWSYWYCDSTAVVLLRTDRLATARPPGSPWDKAACAPTPRTDATAS